MEDRWLHRAKRLEAIASTGLHFSTDAFDRERYREVADIAFAMLADLGNLPIAPIEGLNADFAKGYATPKIDVRGAVIEDGRVLLVRERSDGLWTLPGGYADVGISPSGNVVKEVREEAGIDVAAERLYAIWHKARHAYAPDPRDFYKLFFLCRRLDTTPPAAGPEVDDVGFFPPDRLPPLSRGRVIERDIAAAFEFLADPGRVAVFD